MTLYARMMINEQNELVRREGTSGAERSVSVTDRAMLHGEERDLTLIVTNIGFVLDAGTGSSVSTSHLAYKNIQPPQYVMISEERVKTPDIVAFLKEHGAVVASNEEILGYLVAPEARNKHVGWWVHFNLSEALQKPIQEETAPTFPSLFRENVRL